MLCGVRNTRREYTRAGEHLDTPPFPTYNFNGNIPLTVKLIMHKHTCLTFSCDRVLMEVRSNAELYIILYLLENCIR